VNSFSLSAISGYLPAHGPFSHLALRLALRSMRALATLALPPFDAHLLSVVPPTLARGCAPFCVFGAVPRRALADGSSTSLSLSQISSACLWAPARRSQRLCLISSGSTRTRVSQRFSPPVAPVRRVTRDAPRCEHAVGWLSPGGAFDVLENQLRELVLALMPDVDEPTCGRSLGALAKAAEGLEVLELWFQGKSDEVRARLFLCLIAALTRVSGFRPRCKRL
jgi:hypothetical protein